MYKMYFFLSENFLYEKTKILCILKNKNTQKINIFKNLKNEIYKIHFIHFLLKLYTKYIISIKYDS